MTDQHPQRIFWKSATPDDFKNVELLDWIEGVGEITTQYELNFIRAFGCASHSTGKQDIATLKKAIIEVLDTGFESSERDMALVLDRIDAWEKGEIHNKTSQWGDGNNRLQCRDPNGKLREGTTLNEATYPIPGDEQCRICSQAVRQDEREKVLDEVRDACAVIMKKTCAMVTGVKLSYILSELRQSGKRVSQ